MKAYLLILQLVLASLVSTETAKSQKRGPRQYFEQGDGDGFSFEDLQTSISAKIKDMASFQHWDPPVHHHDDFFQNAINGLGFHVQHRPSPLPQGYGQQPYAVQSSLPALPAPAQYPQGPSQHQALEPHSIQHTPQKFHQDASQYPSTGPQYQQGTSEFQTQKFQTTQYAPPVAPVHQAVLEPNQYLQQGAQQYQSAEQQPSQYNHPVEQVAPVSLALPQSTEYSQQGAQYQAVEPQPTYNPPVVPVHVSHAAPAVPSSQYQQQGATQYQAPESPPVQYSTPVAQVQEAQTQYPQQGIAQYQAPAPQTVQYSPAVAPVQEVAHYSQQPQTNAYDSGSSKDALSHQTSYSAPVSNDISQYAEQPGQAKIPNLPSTPIQPGRAYGPAPPVTVPPVKAPQYPEQQSSYETTKPSPSYEVSQHNRPHESTQTPAVPAKSDSQWEAGTIPYVLEKLGFNSFNDLFVLAGIESLIEKEGPITVLVPPDAAFDALSKRFGGTEAALEQFEKQPEALVSLLKAHIIPGIYPAESLIDNYVSRSLLGTPLRVKHFEAEDHEWRPLRVVTVNGARVVRTGIPAKNGLIHILDRPMFPVPSADIYTSLKNDPEQRFKTLVSAIETAGLVYQLANPLDGPYTLFAPTDKAFSYVSSAELIPLFSNPYKLAKLLQRHLVKDLIYTTGLQGFQKAYALDYELLYIYHMKGMTKVNGASFVDSDVTTLNGVIHSIDSVLGL